jgi:hypothetical protein
MKIRVKGIDQPQTLVIRDVETNHNHAIGILICAGAMDDGQFLYDEYNNEYHCSKEIFDWWKDYFSGQTKINERVRKLHKKMSNKDKILLFTHLDRVKTGQFDVHYVCMSKILDEWEMLI